MEIKLNLEPSPLDIRDYKAEAILSSEGEIPEEFSLIDDLQEVRNQGKYGTCAAQVGACIKEWQERIESEFNEHMSPQFIYDNRINKPMDGMNSRDLMKILNKVGCCPEKMYPYAKSTELTDEIFKTALQYTIQSYAKVDTIVGLKKALIKSGPCLIAVPVYNYGLRMWKQENPLDTMIGGHAMSVVGYNRDGFIIRNSWGTAWGSMGYTVFPYEDWGSQWEVWSTIDKNDMDPVIVKNANKKGFWRKLWDFLVDIFTL